MGTQSKSQTQTQASNESLPSSNSTRPQKTNTNSTKQPTQTPLNKHTPTKIHNGHPQGTTRQGHKPGRQGLFRKDRSVRAAGIATRQLFARQRLWIPGELDQEQRAQPRLERGL